VIDFGQEWTDRAIVDDDKAAAVRIMLSPALSLSDRIAFVPVPSIWNRPSDSVE
jgi:hypothetical protein